MFIKTRTAVRWISFSLAVCLCFGGLALSARNELRGQNDRNDTVNSAAYRQSITDLAQALQNMDLALQKGMYASTDTQSVTWAAQVWREAGAARTCLEQLPIYDLHLDKTRQFLNQIGEYSLYLAKKQLNGTELTETETKSLQELSAAAQELSTQINTLSGRIAEENMDIEGFQTLFAPSEEGTDPTEMEQLENIFEGMSPLSYNGPFSGTGSDWISSWITQQPAKSTEELRTQAEQLLERTDLEVIHRQESPLVLYTFEKEDASVTLTESGYLWYLNRYREIEDAKLEDSAAIEQGAAFLADHGFGILEPIQFRAEGNVLTVTYAAFNNNVLCYPERITVSVALDNGEILRVDGSEWLKNKAVDRNLIPTLTQTDAESILKPSLTVSDCRLVLLPTNDGKAILCYQFHVSNETDTQVLVFINAETGAEEEILILIETEQFRLTI